MRSARFTAALACVAALVVCPACARHAHHARHSRPAASVQAVADGVVLTAGGQNVKVQFYAPGAVRVLKWTAAGTDAKLSLSVIEKSPPKLAVRLSRSAGAVTLDSGKLRVRVSTADGSIRFLARDGRTILAEQGAARFAPANIDKDPPSTCARPSR